MNNLFKCAKEKNIELEILKKEDISTNISILNDEVEKYEVSDVTNYDVKALIDNKIVRCSTETLDNILDVLSNNAKIVEKAEYDFIKDTSNNNKIEVKNTNISYKKILDEMLGLNKLKEKYSELISINVYFEHTKRNIIFANTYGVNKEDQNEVFSYYAEFVLNKDGKNETAFLSCSNVDINKIDLNSKIVEVIEDAYNKFNAKSVKTAKYDVILNPIAMGSLLKSFSNMFDKELIDKKLSILKDKIGKKVFSDKINIVEDPTNETLIGRRLFDNEGISTYYKKIIENGKFITPLYNNKTAKKDNTISTGNSYGVRNMYITNGLVSEEDLIKLLDNGIYINNLEGLHAGVDTISGDISLQATGYEVLNGKKTNALNMIILTTNFFELLNNVIEVSNNLEFYNEICGSPSILFKDITVAGNLNN